MSTGATMTTATTMMISDQATRDIQLSQGKVATVDAADYDHLSQWKWYYSSAGYAMRVPWTKQGEGRKAVLMHRLLVDAKNGEYVDHVNGNKLDNRRANLRICTNAQNAFNQKRRSKTSRFKGVHWSKQAKKWQSLIMVSGRSIHLGYHINEEEAALAYDQAARQYFGEFARINFPGSQVV